MHEDAQTADPYPLPFKALRNGSPYYPHWFPCLLSYSHSNPKTPPRKSSLAAISPRQDTLSSLFITHHHSLHSIPHPQPPHFCVTHTLFFKKISLFSFQRLDQSFRLIGRGFAFLQIFGSGRCVLSPPPPTSSIIASACSLVLYNGFRAYGRRSGAIWVTLCSSADPWAVGLVHPVGFRFRKEDFYPDTFRIRIS